MSEQVVPTRLLPVPELHRLAGDAVALMREARRLALSESVGREEDVAEDAVDRMRDAGLQTMHFVAAAAALSGDGGLLEDVVLLLAAWRESGGAEDDVAWSMSVPVEPLVRAVGRVTPAVRALAADGSPYVREAVAEGLSAETAPARALLEELARDPHRDVRKAARVRLSNVAPTAFWHAWFDADPTEGLGPDEAAALSDACRALDSSTLAYGSHLDAASRALAALGDRHAFALFERLCLSSELHGRALPELAKAVLRRPGAIEVLVSCARRLTGDDVYSLARVVGGAWSDEPADARATRCLDLARAARELPAAERAKPYGPGWMLAQLAGKLWPAEADASPYLELLMEEANPANTVEDDPVQCGLQFALDWDKARFSACVPGLITARLAGYPGRRRAYAYYLDRVLATLPWDRLSDAVERARESDIDEVRRWAFAQLTREAVRRMEAGEDPIAVGRELYDSPLRALVIGSSLEFLPLLRLELRAGRLSFHEATRLFEGIGTLFGGAGEDLFEDQPDTRLQHQAQRRRLLGPAELQGPPTAEEWARLRALRDAVTELDEAFWSAAIDALPPGPLMTEDRPFIERLVEAAIAGAGGDAEPRLETVAGTLYQHARPDLLELFERLLAATDDRAERRDIERARANAFARLGLAEPETKRLAIRRGPKLSVIPGKES